MSTVDIIELNLHDALEYSDDSEVNYHIREALQKLVASGELSDDGDTDDVSSIELSGLDGVAGYDAPGTRGEHSTWDDAVEGHLLLDDVSGATIPVNVSLEGSEVSAGVLVSLTPEQATEYAEALLDAVDSLEVSDT